jgi:hypothetical protein
MSTARKSRWFAYSLRTLFVAVTAASCIVGWIVYQLDWIKQRRAVLANYSVTVPVICFIDKQDCDSAPWPLAWFGEQAAGSPEFYLPATTPDAEVIHIQSLFPETHVERDR